jgi:hypothetical protein
MFTHQNPEHAFSLPHTRYMSRTSLSSWFNHPPKSGWGVQNRSSSLWRFPHSHVTSFLLHNSKRFLVWDSFLSKESLYIHIYMILYDIYLTAIGLTPGGSSTSHIHTQTVHIVQRKENWEVRSVARLWELYPGICLTAEEKARKNLSYGSTKQEQ